MNTSNKLAIAGVLLAFATTAHAAPAADNWDGSCSRCHSSDGSGSGKMGKKLKLKDYTDAAVQAGLKDADMVKAIKEGVKDEAGTERMKSFKDELSDTEVTDLVAYIRKFPEMKKGS
jgi:cytochrome c553